MLAQNINFSFAQQITVLYELQSGGNAANVYLVAGHAQGNASVARIIGPRDVGTAFITQFGDVCRAESNNVDFSAQSGCAGSSSARYRLEGCVISMIGVNVTAADSVVNEQIQMTYVNLDRS